MRLIAVLFIFIPGLLAAYGIKLMRDALFAQLFPIFYNIGIQFLVGFILFLLGLSFIGGFIYHRDRKRNLIKPKKKSRENNKKKRMSK